MEAGTHIYREHAIALANDIGNIDLPFDSEGEVTLLLKMGMRLFASVQDPARMVRYWRQSEHAGDRAETSLVTRCGPRFGPRFHASRRQLLNPRR